MTTLYGLTLFLHSWLRWGLLVAVIVLLVRAIGGSRTGRPWDAKDERWYAATVGLVDLQFLLGVLLYAVLSPITQAFFSSPLRMKDSTLRFFGLEHLTLMVASIALIHIGRARSKKADPTRRHRTVWAWSLGAFVLMLAGIPWPFFPAGRALFRSFGFSSAPVAVETGKDAPSTAQACPPAYAARCASCHGDHGRGDGIAAKALNPSPRDFASERARTRTDAELLAVIRDGGAAHGLSPLMPPGTGLTQADLDALVGCVRSFQKVP